VDLPQAAGPAHGGTWGQLRYRRIRGSVHGPGRASSAVIRLVSWRPPSRGRPDRGRSASPGEAAVNVLQLPVSQRLRAGLLTWLTIMNRG
jgi:hypothetical protein